MTALPLPHDGGPPPVSLLCLVFLLLLPACPASVPTSTERPATTIRASGPVIPTECLTAPRTTATTPWPATARSSATAARPYRLRRLGAATVPMPPQQRGRPSGHHQQEHLRRFCRRVPDRPQQQQCAVQSGGDISTSWAVLPKAAAAGPGPTATSSSSRRHDRHRDRGGTDQAISTARPATTWSASPAVPSPASSAAAPRRPKGPPMPVQCRPRQRRTGQRQHHWRARLYQQHRTGQHRAL